MRCLTYATFDLAVGVYRFTVSALWVIEGPFDTDKRCAVV